MSLIILISVIPVILLALFVYSKDSVKEPKPLLMALFASGFVAATVVIIINLGLSSFIPDFFVTDNYEHISFYKLFSVIFLEIAFIEEFSKWIMIVILGYHNKNFDQLYDIVVYSVFVALGFACIENIFYLIPNSLSLGIYRAIFSIPGHACFGVFMGSYLGLAKIYEDKDKMLSRVYMFYAVLVPTLLHTAYNFCLLANSKYFFIVFLIFMVILYIISILKIDRISKNTEQINIEEL
ncbi:MAG: PrsW family intramembrane metalloprotease [Bacilli bacterium]|nr:PrsW family intramembrane metalloprotease [Bacilli bacterium]